MPVKAIVFVDDGSTIRKREMVWDGVSLTDDKNRQKFLIRSKPRGMTLPGRFGIGSRSMQAFFASSKTSTSFDPIPEDYDGVTIEGPTMMNVGIDQRPGMPDRPYIITPEQIYERSDSSDLKALNLARGMQKQLLLLAMGAGGAAMVILYFAWSTFQGAF